MQIKKMKLFDFWGDFSFFQDLLINKNLWTVFIQNRNLY